MCRLRRVVIHACGLDLAMNSSSGVGFGQPLTIYRFFLPFFADRPERFDSRKSQSASRIVAASERSYCRVYA